MDQLRAKLSRAAHENGIWQMNRSTITLRSRLAATTFALLRPAPTRPAATGLISSLLMSALLAGCSTMERPDEESGRASVANSVVDSILPAEVELERFQAGLPRPDSLAAGAPSREGLVRRYVAALEAGDTLALDSLALSRAEFAYLYYPTSQYTREPYRMSPALLWFMVGENGHKGSRRAVRHYGDRPFGYAGHRCDPEPTREGENLLWTGCVLIRARPGEADLLGEANPFGETNVMHDTGETASGAPGIRLFGTIVEYRGRYKFLSFANAL